MAVARRAQRQVSSSPFPGARLQSAETATSQGAGLEQAKAQKLGTIASFSAGAANLAASAAGRMIEEERQNANEVALLKASNRLAAWKTERLYDPEKGALTLKGEAAMPLPEQIGDEFNKVADEVALGLGNDDQKRAFEKLRSQSFQQTDLEVRRHVFNQMQEFRAGELKAAIETGADEAIRAANDPKLVGASLGKVESQMRTNLPKLGLGPEAVDQQVAAVRSNVHLGVINQLLAQEQDSKAADYLKEARGEIAADKLDDATRAVDEGTLRGQAQSKTDEITAAGGTLKEQQEKTKGLEPKLRDEVNQRLEHAQILKERVEKETEEQSMRTGYDIIDKTGSVNKIPAAQWASYNGSTRSAMRSYADQKAKGIPVKTDLPTYYGLIRQAMNDPEAFADVNLLSSRHLLDEPEFKQLAGVQMSIKNGNRTAADKELGSFRTSSQVVDDALVGIGVNPNASVEKEPVIAGAVSNLRRLVDTQVADIQNATGKKATSKDVQSIVDGILAQQVTAKGTWGGLFTSAPFYDTTKPLIQLTIDDIPAEQKKQIEQALGAKGRPVSDATVLNLYLEAVARGKIKP